MRFRLLMLACAVLATACAAHAPAPCAGPYEPVNPVTAEVPHV